MSYNVNFPYGQGTKQVVHESAPPLGRTVVGGDFATMIIGNVAVGMVQRFSIRESRDVMPIYELGNIYIAEMVPSTWSGNLDISRVDIFKDSIFDALSYNAALSKDTYKLAAYWPSDKVGPIQGGGANVGASGTSGDIVTILADMQWPVDFALSTNNPDPATNGVTVKTFKECWITSYGASYESGAKTVLETATFGYRNASLTVSTPPISSLDTAPSA